MIREKHPYDRGYWRRYDGKTRPRKADADARRGWDDCDAELKFEKEELVP